MSEDGRRPRSRFDTGDAPPPRSRFDRDRRSRSPSTREPENRRTRSPVGREATGSPSTVTSEKKASAPDPAAAARAAAAAAARINAQIQAKKAVQEVAVPPIRTAITTPPVARSPATPSSTANKGQAVVGEAYQQDGDFIQDIEINDLRNRYTLTKGAVQKKVNQLLSSY